MNSGQTRLEADSTSIIAAIQRNQRSLESVSAIMTNIHSTFTLFVWRFTFRRITKFADDGQVHKSAAKCPCRNPAIAQLHYVSVSLCDNREIVSKFAINEDFRKAVFETYQAILQIQRELPPQILRQQPVYLQDAKGLLAPFYLEFVISKEVRNV